MKIDIASSSLAGRVAVVTGASSGIGRATVLQFLAAGAKVLANARRPERLDELKDSAANAEHLSTFAGDASDPETIERMLVHAETSLGAVDLVVVNAGRGLSGSLLTSDVSQWNGMVSTNVLGAMHLMRTAGLRMQRRRETSPALATPMDIVVLGSTVGRHISPFSSAYGATKFAIGSAAEALRRELGPKGIRVSLIEPGIVRSEFQQVAGYSDQWFQEFSARIGPVLEPGDIARAIGFIVSQPAHVHINDIVIRPTRQDYP